ncbi:MAG: dihydroorotase [Clostridia bacterium]|nr:dihydroorotase [Clostridia bacterium]
MNNFKANISIGNKGTDKQKTALISDFLLQVKGEYNCPKFTIMPGFCDVHVHLREPGFAYKESMETGTKACARGGYTTVLAMPNLNPVPDSKEHVKDQLKIIEKDAVIEVYPYGSITVGQRGQELSDLEGMVKDVIAFSDDGKGVQTDEMMKTAMQKAKDLGKMIVAHCEVNDLLFGGYIHDGKYAKEHNHKGICSQSEYEQVKRDLELVREVGCSYHVCHVSTKESVELIRQAKKEGLDVSCETAPHYLVLDDSNLKEDGAFKMNTPLRDKSDKLALIEGIKDGTIEMIATDHAPHSKEEKSKGLEKSAFGIVGIETAFQVLYTHLVKKNVITLDELVDLLVNNPRKRFGLKDNGFSVWDLEEDYVIKGEDFLSKGKSTPFENMQVKAVNYITVANNRIVYEK